MTNDTTLGSTFSADDAACALMQTTGDGTFVAVNRMFCKWLGYEPAALIGRVRLQELLTMGGRIFHQTHWAPLLQMQGSLSEVKLELLHRDGSVIPMVLNALRRTHEGVLIHELAAYMARDRDKYERELLMAHKRLEELVAERTRLLAESKDRALFAEQMIGIVSHDLRNPLTTIGLAAAMLASGQDLSEKQRRTLARLSRSNERANRLVADLLDFTQARVGRGLTASRETIDLHETVSQALEELALAYPGRTLRHLRFGESTCSADANRIGQLIGNLVSNAMAYGLSDRPVSVTSSVDPTSLSITVHNEGEPISDEAQKQLFEPMTRGAAAGQEANASKAGRSVGLGLYIVREIAKAHGGTVLVRSTAEEGTTFTVNLPSA